MGSVTDRIAEVKQPRGGYIPPTSLKEKLFNYSNGDLLGEENIHPGIVGTVVDYLTRKRLGASAEQAFQVSLQGAAIAEQAGLTGSVEAANAMVADIESLAAASIINACNLVSFDVWVRNPSTDLLTKPHGTILPDSNTIDHIRKMTERSWKFFGQFKNVTSNFNFEPVNTNEKALAKMIDSGRGTYGGYTPTIDSGDGDYLTKNCLWELKTSIYPPTSKHTLQILTYWIMGLHSGQPAYEKINELGIFNARDNLAYTIKTRDIPEDVIRAVEKDVIGYTPAAMRQYRARQDDEASLD